MTTLDCVACGQRYHGQSIGYRCRKCGGETREPCKEKRRLNRQRFHARREQCQGCDCFGPVVIDGNKLHGCNRLSKPCGVEKLWFVDREDWCPAGGVVRQPIDITQFTTTRPSTDDFVVVTTHFNPCKFDRLRDTYCEWLPSVEPIRDRLRVYELVLDDDEPEVEGSIVVRGSRDRHFVWQKEPLLNRALAETQSKYFAWVDHDLLFSNPRWLADGIERLRQGSVACQLFSQLSWLDIERRKTDTRQSGMANKGKGPPGGAWVAETQFVRDIGGFETSNIFGGGDQTFFDALNFTSGWHLSQYSHAMRKQVSQWIDNARRVRGERNASCVKSDAVHLFHGTRKNRQYADRYTVLTKEDFDPSRDLIINDDGILEWTGRSVRLASAVRRFFENRKEDQCEPSS